jgi:hypothetical protein
MLFSNSFNYLSGSKKINASKLRQTCIGVQALTLANALGIASYAKALVHWHGQIRK